MKISGNGINYYKSQPTSFKGISVREIPVQGAKDTLYALVKATRAQDQMWLPYADLSDKRYVKGVLSDNMPVRVLENPYFETYVEHYLGLKNYDNVSLSWVKNNARQNGVKLNIEECEKPTYKILTFTDEDRDELVKNYSTIKGTLKRFFYGTYDKNISSASHHFTEISERGVSDFLYHLQKQVEDKSFFNMFLTSRTKK